MMNLFYVLLQSTVNYKLCSFAWHATDETKIVAVTVDGVLSEVRKTNEN